jgi:hypothetical protein
LSAKASALALSRASFSSSDDAGDRNGIGSDTEFLPARRAAAREAEACKAIVQAVEKRAEQLRLAPVPSAICSMHQFIADQQLPLLSLFASMSANRFDST